MACNSTKLASHGVCATVIPINDHTTTSTSKAMVPKNLRVRIVMAKMCSSFQFTRLARGRRRTIRCAQIHSSAASMTDISTPQKYHNRAVSWWLVSIAALIAIMVLVGGATRLTEAGLSIVEWKPVTGTLLPFSQVQCTQAFEAYKTIPQYRELNAGMSLAEFKTIFWWEWSHRLLGRVIGAVYLLPFLWFLWRGALSADLRRRLWLIFGLGALQGAVGWWMVASGLSQRGEGSQYRVAPHLGLALFIFSAGGWAL